MKKIFKPMILMFMLMAAFMSCNNEELFIEDAVEDVVDDTTGEDTEEEEIDDTSNEDTSIDTTLPCDFDLSDVTAGDTVVINCVMDLEGATVNLPADVTILYEGGDIINGTLNFSDNTTISGELLNSSLETTGSSPILKDPVFEFIPERWGIVEGVVDDDTAYNNKLIFNDILNKVKNLGASTIKIDALDAYFQTVPNSVETNQTPQDAALQVPSDIHLIMTENTHLREQPNGYKNTVLFAIYRVSNVIVEGGIFHGERDEHDYSSGGTHEWGHTIRVVGAENVVIKGITSMDAGGDGIAIGSYGHAYDTHYRPTDGLTITDCVIKRNRRNGISIGDGRNILIENNQFIDNGVDTELSKGTPPRMAIDIEAQNSGGVVYQIAKDIIIRDNIETGAQNAAFYIASGYNVLIEDNATQGAISYYHTYNSIIRNNTITATSPDHFESDTGITAGVGFTEYSNYNNKVYNNTVTGYAFGLDVVGYDTEIYDNTFINCKNNIILNQLRDSKIYNNTVTSDVERSMGILTKAATKSLDGVSVYGNTINVAYSVFHIININEDTEDLDKVFTIYSNTGESQSTSSINYTNGLSFKDNIINGGLRMVGSFNCIFSNNTITTDGAIGLDFSSENSDIQVFGNTITINGSADCIRDKELNTDLSITDNTCN